MGLGTWQLRQNGDLLELTYTAPSSFSLFMDNYPTLVGGDRDPEADPDHDGLINFNEFASGSRPDSAASVPLRRVTLANDTSSGSPHLVLTLAIRAAAPFSGSGPLVAIKDGIIYRVEGSANLSDFTLGVEKLSPAIPGGLPLPLSGYEYRSFRLTAPVSSHPQGFLRSALAPDP